ncbi:MAG: hypothetical protein ABFD54_02995 [Armatimonadota bacterium]|nr:hypothetical protein [bacterium]
MGEGKRRLLIVLTIAMFIAMVAAQSLVDPMQVAIRKGEKSVSSSDNSELMVQLPGQFVLASAVGFKEVIAGALWVRADTFFHEGEYQAIVPIVRLVTWLDPHNIDVFTTGAWHLDYNFVDENQLSDKRYIPASVALLKEGIANNPNIWDLYFELAWTHYNKKIGDQQQALYWMKKACEHDGYDVNSGKKVDRPEFVDRMLAHQYEKIGDFDNAVKQWYKARKRVEHILKKNVHTSEYVDASSLDVCDRNLALLLLRMAWRYGDMDAYKQGIDVAMRVGKHDRGMSQWKQATLAAKKDYEQRLASGKPFGDVRKPIDAGFQVSVKRLSPKVLLISGKLNLVPTSEYQNLASECFTNWFAENQKADANNKVAWRDGSRVSWMLADYGYKTPDLKTFNWKLDNNSMVVWDSIYVQGGSFSSKIDLSKNPDFYPFKAKKYTLTVWVSPQQPSSPDFIQDRIGWKGEALTDKNYLDTKMLPGSRCLKWEKTITREQLL